MRGARGGSVPNGVEMRSTVNPAMEVDGAASSTSLCDTPALLDGEHSPRAELRANLRNSMRSGPAAVFSAPEFVYQSDDFWTKMRKLLWFKKKDHSAIATASSSAGFSFISIAKSPEKQGERRFMRVRKLLEATHLALTVGVLILAVGVMHMTYDNECRCLLENAWEHSPELQADFAEGPASAHTKYYNLYYYASRVTHRVPSRVADTNDILMPDRWALNHSSFWDAEGAPQPIPNENWDVDPYYLSISNYCHCDVSTESWEVTFLKLGMVGLSLLAAVVIVCRALVQTKLHALRGQIPAEQCCVYDRNQWTSTAFELILNLLVVPPWFHVKYDAEIWKWGGVTNSYVAKRMFKEHANVWNVIVFFRLYTLFRVIRNHSGFANVHAELVSASYGISSSSIRFATKMVLRQYPIQAMIPVFGITVMATSTMLWMLEAGAPGGINRFDQCIWCTVTTMSTVGYGDMYPITVKGRLAVGIFGFAGGMVFSTLAIASVLEWVRSTHLCAAARRSARACTHARVPFPPPPSLSPSLFPAHPSHHRRVCPLAQYDLTVQEIAIVEKLRDERRARSRRILGVRVIQKWWHLLAHRKRTVREAATEQTLLFRTRRAAKMLVKGPHRYEAALLRDAVKARSHRREDQARATHTDAVVASMQEQMDIEREESLEWRAEMAARSTRLSRMVSTLLETMSPNHPVLLQVKEAELEGRELRRARRSASTSRTPRSGRRAPSRASSRTAFRGDPLLVPPTASEAKSPTESSGSSTPHDMVLHEEAEDAAAVVFSPPPPAESGGADRVFVKPAMTFTSVENYHL